MFLVVGLGNLGEKYKNNRHNLGWQVLNKFQKENDFPEFETKKNINAMFSESESNVQKILLAKPQTFMNSSGGAVKKITTHYKLPTTNLIVVHDDIDLALGKIKISRARGSAGHKGVESIIKALGTKNFSRLRLGIQPEKGKPKNVESFVVKNFLKKEEIILESVISEACQKLKDILKE